MEADEAGCSARGARAAAAADRQLLGGRTSTGLQPTHPSAQSERRRAAWRLAPRGASRHRTCAATGEQGEGPLRLARGCESAAGRALEGKERQPSGLGERAVGSGPLELLSSKLTFHRR